MNKPLTIDELFFGEPKEFEPAGEIDVHNIGAEYDEVLTDIENGKYAEELTAVEKAYTPFDTLDEAGESRNSLQDLIEAANDTADNRAAAVKHERTGDVR